MSSSQSAGNVNQLPSQPVDSLLEDDELYTSAAARHRAGQLTICITGWPQKYHLSKIWKDLENRTGLESFGILCKMVLRVLEFQ